MAENQLKEYWFKIHWCKMPVGEHLIFPINFCDSADLFQIFRQYTEFLEELNWMKNRIFLTPGKTTIFGPTQVCFKNQNSCLVNNLFRVSVVCLFVLTIFLGLKFTYVALRLSRKIQNKHRYSKNVKSESNILKTFCLLSENWERWKPKL